MKKFLDVEGLKHLWSKVSLQDYPNNDVLVAVINALDETKADKDEVPTDVVLYSPQTLTEEQKAQARANLGITEINNDNNTEVTPPTGEVTTTEYIYTYDGDKDTDANTWITNYGNIRVFVKMGEVPKGEWAQEERNHVLFGKYDLGRRGTIDFASMKTGILSASGTL